MSKLIVFRPLEKSGAKKFQSNVNIAQCAELQLQKPVFKTFRSYLTPSLSKVKGELGPT